MIYMYALSGIVVNIPVPQNVSEGEQTLKAVMTFCEFTSHFQITLKMVTLKLHTTADKALIHAPPVLFLKFKYVLHKVRNILAFNYSLLLLYVPDTGPSNLKP